MSWIFFENLKGGSIVGDGQEIANDKGLDGQTCCQPAGCNKNNVTNADPSDGVALREGPKRGERKASVFVRPSEIVDDDEDDDDSQCQSVILHDLDFSVFEESNGGAESHYENQQ